LGKLVLGIDALSPVEADRERADGENASHQEERNQRLREHYMNPKITAPQNRKAKAATKRASLS
jgi:hemolysin activation/secretion protein